jgi:hypothetical protein
MNYNQFLFWEFNRKINPAHVRGLAERIKNVGYKPELKVFVTPLTNEVVKNKHIILDGQHRVKACMELNVEFTYEIIKDAITKTQIEDHILLYNIDRDNLTLEDYLYINRNLAPYQKLIELREKTLFPVSVLLSIYQPFNLKGPKGRTKVFANGGYTIDDYGVNKILNVKRVFDIFKEVKKPNFKGSENAYIKAISSILSNQKVDIDLLCKKIQINGEMIEFRDSNSNILILYAIYNKHNSSKLDIPAILNRFY